MYFRKLVSAALVLCMCLGTACAQITTENSESDSQMQTTYAASESAAIVNMLAESDDDSADAAKLAESQEYTQEGNEESSIKGTADNSEDLLNKPEAEENSVKGDYEWNPYVWSDTLTNAYGESCKQTMFNCIEAILNGEDTFDYVDKDDVWKITMAAYVVCPYLFKIVGYDISTDGDKAVLSYQCSPEEAKQIIDDFAKNCEEIINESVVKGDLPETKALMVHYNFSKSLTYDYVASEDAEPEPGDTVDHMDISPYRAIVQREGICQSFAMALVHLYLQCGLDANIASGESPQCSHMWVYMILDGERIFIDPTWEDTHDGTGMSFFGINTSVYNDNDYYVDPFLFFEDESFGATITSEKYKPLWGMQKINSIERHDWEVVIDFINAEGENVTYTVPD